MVIKFIQRVKVEIFKISYSKKEKEKVDDTLEDKFRNIIIIIIIPQSDINSSLARFETPFVKYHPCENNKVINRNNPVHLSIPV